LGGIKKFKVLCSEILCPGGGIPRLWRGGAVCRLPDGSQGRQG